MISLRSVARLQAEKLDTTERLGRSDMDEQKLPLEELIQPREVLLHCIFFPNGPGSLK